MPTITIAVKVIYFIYTLEGGGAERQLKYLLNGHSDHIERAVCYVDPDGVEVLNANVERFHIPRKHKFDLRWRPITQLLKSWQPDIVINWLPYVVIHTLVPTRLAGVPTYLSALRNTYSLKSPRELPRWVNHWQANGIASNTHPDEQSPAYQWLCKKKPFRWVPNGFDASKIEDAQPSDLTQFGFRPDIPTLLFVGRLTTIKNPTVLINIMQRLKEKGMDVQLLICGQGVLETELKQMIANAGFDERIHLTGYRRDIFSLMKASTLLIHPSRQEGLPNVIIEAMAAGLPVVASSIPVHTRWIVEGKNGLTAAPDDIHRFTNHVCQLLTNQSLRDSFVTAGHELANQLTIPRMVQAYETWYEEIVS